MSDGKKLDFYRYQENRIKGEKFWEAEASKGENSLCFHGDSLMSRIKFWNESL
jgi:hypothetical protein